MIVRIPGLLQSYTDGVETVEVAATGTLGEALDALDARFPGLRFRIVDEQAAIRPHIKLFVDGVLARSLSMPLAAGRGTDDRRSAVRGLTPRRGSRCSAAFSLRRGALSRYNRSVCCRRKRLRAPSTTRE